jgi:hypothetical protein
MPKTRRQQEAEAAAAAAAPAESPEEAPTPKKQPRKTTARKAPKDKKKEEAPPEPAPEAAPEAAPSATRDDVLGMLLSRLTVGVPEGTTDEQKLEALGASLDGLIARRPVVDYETVLVLEELQEEIVEEAIALLAPPPSPPAESGSAAAAAQAAQAAPSEDDLLAEARRQPPAPAAPADDSETEDTPGPSPQQVMSIKVPITGQALQYTIEVRAKSPGPIPMDASQATASQGSIDEEAAAAPGAFDPSQLSIRWYPVTDAGFPEKLGERMNLIFPAHKMAPVSWSDMKEAHRMSGETYFAVTLAQVAPGSVFGQDYTLVTGEPKKVAVAGVINTYKNAQTGALTVNILDIGTREDLLPKSTAVNPYLALVLSSLANQVVTPSVVVRYSRKQLATDSEYLSTRNTFASLGIPLSSFTRGGPEGKETLFKIRAEEKPVDVSAVKLRPEREGPDRILYEYREEGTGAVKSFSASAVDRLYTLGRRGVEITPIVEFVGTIGAMLTPATAPETDITLPDVVLRDGFKRVEPRRGGRKVTSRQSSSPKRKGPSSGQPRGYTRRRRA